MQNLVGALEDWRPHWCGTGGAQRWEGLVTGSGECGVWNCSLPEVETLLDLLTHFIGIGKTT